MFRSGTSAKTAKQSTFWGRHRHRGFAQLWDIAARTKQCAFVKPTKFCEMSWPTPWFPNTELSDHAWVWSLSVAHRLCRCYRSNCCSSKNARAAKARAMVRVVPTDANRSEISEWSRNRQFLKFMARTSRSPARCRSVWCENRKEILPERVSAL